MKNVQKVAYTVQMQLLFYPNIHRLKNLEFYSLINLFGIPNLILLSIHNNILELLLKNFLKFLYFQITMYAMRPVSEVPVMIMLSSGSSIGPETNVNASGMAVVAEMLIDLMMKKIVNRLVYTEFSHQVQNILVFIVQLSALLIDSI